MKQETSDVLRALNLRFYATQADPFSSTRAQPWRGCERVLGHVTTAAPAVLDIGCGNGRLMQLLARRCAHGFAYTGVDASAQLLALAAERFAAHAPRLLQTDFMIAEPSRALPDASYDMVALFGVMHHVPQEPMRRRLLEAAAARVAAGGVLALTVWRFDEDERLMRRCVPAADCARLDPALRDAYHDLDPGDHLLYWGERRDALRYCHAADDAELARWLHGLDLVTIDRFRAAASGERMNEYLVLQRSRAALESPGLRC
jgi:SAM-dependent methyltransferase